MNDRPSNPDRDPRSNPAEPRRWNAWRFPTVWEVADGRGEDDPYWVGASRDKAEAAAMLRPYGGGQIQWDLDGTVETI